MPITVNSPYSGRPVKVRDQDVGRAVRDEDGRIFYVVPRASGEGFYAAPTRLGSEKDERRYDDLLDQLERSETLVAEQQQAVRDATGKKRRRPRVLLAVIVLILLAGLAYALVHRQQTGGWPLVPPPDTPPARQPETTPPPDAAPEDGDPAPETGDAAQRGPERDATAVAGRRAPLDDLSADAVLSEAMSIDTPLDHRHPAARSGEADRRGEFTRLASGLMVRVDRTGVGQPAAAGQYVELRYRDKSFDSPARLDDQPWQAASFVLWTGDAPRGWDQALAGMKPGERRTALIPQPAPGGQMRYDVAEFELLAVLPGVTHDTELTGQGPMLRPGEAARVHYQAYVQGGDAAFADTRATDTPVTFTLGEGDVIEGLELGVAGMRVGEVRSITIPPHLAYGSKSIGEVVPADATLVFVVELLEIR